MNDAYHIQFLMKRAPVLALVGTLLAACVVQQPLGAQSRDDGAVSDDAALPLDAPRSLDGPAPSPEASMATADAPEASSTRPETSIPPSDAASIQVQGIEIELATLRPLPALGTGSTSVTVSFRERPPVPLPTDTVLDREGDCTLQEGPPRSPAPAPTLDGVTIRVSAPGQPTIMAQRDTAPSSVPAVGRYRAEFPSRLPAGAVVRVEVDGFGSIPSFTRDVVVSDLRYTSPSPITDHAMARYLTRPSGQPLLLQWQVEGGAPSSSVFTLTMVHPDPVVRQLRCALTNGTTMTQIAARLLDRAEPFAQESVGGPVATLVTTVERSSPGLPDGTAVIVRSVASLVAGFRF